MDRETDRATYKEIHEHRETEGGMEGGRAGGIDRKMNT